MEAIYQTLIHTPTWVYLLFAYLIWRDILALKPQVRPLKKLFILPIIFAFISVHSLMTEITPSAFYILIWVLSIASGIIIGWFQIFRLSLQVDREHHLIRVPGS